MSLSFPMNSKFGSGHQENTGLSLLFFFGFWKSFFIAPKNENCRKLPF